MQHQFNSCKAFVTLYNNFWMGFIPSKQEWYHNMNHASYPKNCKGHFRFDELQVCQWLQIIWWITEVSWLQIDLMNFAECHDFRFDELQGCQDFRLIILWITESVMTSYLSNCRGCLNFRYIMMNSRGVFLTSSGPDLMNCTAKSIVTELSSGEQYGRLAPSKRLLFSPLFSRRLKKCAANRARCNYLLTVNKNLPWLSLYWHSVILPYLFTRNRE
jgi:hypothetical protein